MAFVDPEIAIQVQIVADTAVGSLAVCTTPSLLKLRTLSTFSGPYLGHPHEFTFGL